MTSAKIVRFLKALKHHRRRPVLLLWDRLPAYRSRTTRQALREHRRWLKVEWPPSYVCALNAVEALWGHFDQTALANAPIEDLGWLRQPLSQAIRRVERHPEIGRRFLRYTGLF